MRRMVLILALALGAAHAAAMTAPETSVRERLVMRIATGADDRHRATFRLAGRELRSDAPGVARAMAQRVAQRLQARH